MTYNKVPRKPLRGQAREDFINSHGRRCIYCHQIIPEGEKWEDAHIIARELGGSDELENRGPAHIDCHKNDTRWVKKMVAKSNRIRRKHGLDPDRRKPRPKMKSRGFTKNGPKAKIPSKPFPKRAKP